MRDLAVSFSLVWVLTIAVTCLKYYKQFWETFHYNTNISITGVEEYHCTLLTCRDWSQIRVGEQEDILAEKHLRLGPPSLQLSV